MNTSTGRVLVAVVAIAVASVFFVVLKNDDNGNSTDNGKEAKTDGSAGGNTTAKVPTIVIEDGKPVGGIRELAYEKGDRVRFRVTSDTSEEIHVHGYDLAKDVEAGGTVSFDFPATIEGIFEAELEARGVQIAELRVNP
jgi:uncharacterized protein YdeI (BOF family)